MRLPKEQRRALIVSTAVMLANRADLTAVTPHNVAQHCEYSTSFMTVRRYFKTRSALWSAVVIDPRASEAVRAQGVSLGLLSAA